MDMNDYQDGALSTAIFPEEYKILYPALKLAGEAGEVAEKVGKVLRDNGGEFTDEIKQALGKEIGDVLWYCAALSASLGLDLNTVAQGNLDKLASRKERGVIGGSGDER